MKRRSFLLSGAAAGATSVIPHAARAQFTQPFQQAITIGINVPLTGEKAAAGREIVAGVQSAIDENNRFGGTYQTAFNTRVFDDMDALAQAMLNVQFASADSTIAAMIGGFDGSLITASLNSYANARMPLIVPGSTADTITERSYNNVWRLPTKDSMEGQLFARFIGRKDRPKKAVAVAQDGDYGMDVAQGFVNQARPAGFEGQGYSFPFDKPDYSRAAQAILALKPDLVYLCGVTGDMGPLVPALQQAGYKGKFAASQGFYNNATLKSYGDALSGAYISTSFPPLERAPDIANQLSDFKARAPLTALSVFSYAAAQIVISAVRRTGATNRLATLSALQSPATYQTIAGSFQFTPLGDPVDPNLYFYTVTGGKFKFAAPSHATPFLL